MLLDPLFAMNWCRGSHICPNESRNLGRSIRQRGRCARMSSGKCRSLPVLGEPRRCCIYTRMGVSNSLLFLLSILFSFSFWGLSSLVSCWEGVFGGGFRCEFHHSFLQAVCQSESHFMCASPFLDKGFIQDLHRS